MRAQRPCVQIGSRGFTEDFIATWIVKELVIFLRYLEVFVDFFGDFLICLRGVMNVVNKGVFL